MLTISGLGFSNEIAPDTVVNQPAPIYQMAVTAPAPTTQYRMGILAPTSTVSKPSACAAPNVMSEFGCLTPMVPMSGSTASNTVWGCPAGSQPYNNKYCLMTNNVAAEQAAIDAAAKEAAAQAAAQAQAIADAAAKAQADADAAALLAAQQHESEAHQAAADAEAARQQAIADQIAAAAAQAAQDAVAAYVAAHGDGTAPSPGMTVTQTQPPGYQPPAVQPAPKSTKHWWLIGGAIGAGILAAFVSR
jgi:hypothetical protein